MTLSPELLAIIKDVKPASDEEMLRIADIAFNKNHSQTLSLIARIVAERKVTDGWKLVPIEPTREMWAAMADTLYGYKNRHHDKVVSDLYQAMLASTPALSALEERGS